MQSYLTYSPPEGMNEEVKFKHIVGASGPYMLVVAKLKETHYDTYAVINSETGVIEGVQPVLSQALDMMEAFDKWLNDRNNPKRKGLEDVFESIEEA